MPPKKRSSRGLSASSSGSGGSTRRPRSTRASAVATRRNSTPSRPVTRLRSRPTRGAPSPDPVVTLDGQDGLPSSLPALLNLVRSEVQAEFRAQLESIPDPTVGETDGGQVAAANPPAPGPATTRG